MTVQDDVRRLSQMDSIYLGHNTTGMSSSTSWYKGRLQQANDGTWVFRSSGTEGAVVGFQLFNITPDWNSQETPSGGIVVFFQIYYMTQVQTQPPVATQIMLATIFLQQQLPLELTN